ncbi:hypothetical protein HRR83_002889 [Exophiala dermatitidis]|uniref:Mitochondrial protein Fmp25 n=2 Tax=Exophiala dermatitidis TaxID=5970 RepID=H6BXR4_EXODN|nr:uncharacterized protein HMPREF1120_05443 [Exophiala dermatitidis NIH/UT8656]KAJ4516708.1 hypothetical protein HRR75_003368 [Exophiala dermatitidis]EHY57404.1 hypothetical protein HMPREF1120_05443 [Exophiala dermatitidis NIH/UT8656]KAJ4520679.1 hypothetical protein HRR74_003680 [Exophiala dermatitidis]KAJ4521821.1 hypothetical protein HRR73_003020 [Exophiala dermatitidis]KAJ4537677.1 hypothetical protein HRR76_005666 [Exophiala dermatitidis]
MSSTTMASSSLRTLARPRRTIILRPRSATTPRLSTRRHYSSKGSANPSHHPAWVRQSSAILAAAAIVAMVYSTTRLNEAAAEAPATDPPEIKVEKSRKRKGLSKEENRDLISSQHLQVKKSWENPGVYAWGSNTGKVVAPESDEPYIKTPRRIPFFDNHLLRDLKLDRNFGAAILENGDLVQWGKAYSEDTSQPTVTLKGKDLKSIAISRDRIIGLAKNGNVYSIPVSKADQENGPKPRESSWLPLWSSTSPISYRKLTPQNLGIGEKVTAISGGLEHVLLLTSAGRVFSAASSTEEYPSRGQLGVPGLTWLTRPAGSYDMCHELTTLKGFNIEKVATGDTHSLILDKEGRVFAFGDNLFGQLGFEFNPEAPYVDMPSLLPINKLYQGTNMVPKVTGISAGGQNSFFTIDATRVLGPAEDPSDVRTLGRVTADTWACGQGIKGSLGNGRWTHVQDSLTKIPGLSGLFEYDEKKKAVVPIRLARMSIGSTHASAVMDNVTHLDANEKSSEDDTNWGADVLWWGGNEFYQLGTGKRNNVSTPQYIRPLDMASEIAAGRKEQHRLHLTPKHTIKVNGRKVDVEQRVECGRNVTAIYSAV